MRKCKQNIHLLIFTIHNNYKELALEDVWYVLYESEHFGNVRHEIIMDMLNIS